MQVTDHSHNAFSVGDLRSSSEPNFDSFFHHTPMMHNNVYTSGGAHAEQAYMTCKETLVKQLWAAMQDG